MRDKIFEMQAEVCKALGSPVRLEILDSLRGGGKSVGQLAGELGLEQANVSQHLAVLRQRGVVSTRKEGKTIYYSVPNPKVVQACQLMREVLLEQLEETRKLAATPVRTKTR